MTICTSCGTELPDNARFCLQCGTPTAGQHPLAEYKQVTVLFADVVHSMDIAAAVGPERLREIMTDLLDRCAEVVERFGGTLNQFTGDGIMAVFGAPITLKDHAIRACLAALDLQNEMGRLAADVNKYDSVDLRLRVGLNSGQVIAGEVGSGAAGYTTIGEHVGMAQRMESAAPPGGVMLSESTARLVENEATLGEPELVRIKGTDRPAPSRRLLAVGEPAPGSRNQANLVGRMWELNTITAILDEAVGGAGCVVNIVGPPGIGKSRLIREAAGIAAGRGVGVLTTQCESHTREIPFHVLARLLRAGTHISDLDVQAARKQLRNQFVDADPDDLVLLEDLLGIRDSEVELPPVGPDARRRRLTSLINSASLARADPAVYVIEDAQWIDEASESMLTDFLAVIPHSPTLTLITYRPEYRGALAKLSGAQTIALRPLSEAQTSALTTELLGPDPSVAEVAASVAERAAGNPFFAEEMVRDLAERGVLRGQPGAYQVLNDTGDTRIPATLQATIGARIDRLDSTAKRTLNAASVVGTVFDADSIGAIYDDADLAPLIDAELVDQIKYSPRAVYAFRHPLIRAVAYESQLKSDRAVLHRRIATMLEHRDPGEADESAALIAQHFEAAGDMRTAFDWHMRAGSWMNNRDNRAAAKSWRRAQYLADQLPDDAPDKLTKRIAPRTLLCATEFRLGGSSATPGFEALRDLCLEAGDERSLAIGMSGRVMELYFTAQRREASQLATEHIRLLDTIGDPTLTVALLPPAIATKHETAEVTELLHLAQHGIDLADEDATKGRLTAGSPLTMFIAFRGLARWCLGMAGWQDDFRRAVAMARTLDAVTRGGVMYYTYHLALFHGALTADDGIIREMTEILALAEQSGEDVALGLARYHLGFVLIQEGGASRERGLDLLRLVREAALQGKYAMTGLPVVNAATARALVQLGDFDNAIELTREILEELFEGGGAMWTSWTTDVLVDALLKRGGAGDLDEAGIAIDRMAAAPSEPGYVIDAIWLLRMRAQLARAHGDEIAYRDYRDQYRQMATELGFEGHLAWAAAMD